MQIETTVEKIKDAVSRVQRVSAKNLSLPILENVLLQAENNTLTLRSTNLHVGVEISVPVKIKETGTIAVKLDVFAAIISGLSKEHNLSLEVVENTLAITTEKSKMNIKLFPHTDFPTLPQVEDGVNFSLPIEILLEGVSSVVFTDVSISRVDSNRS